MSSYENHRMLNSLTLGKSTDYRDSYDASLLQGVPRSLNHDPLGLKADNLPFYGTDIWTLYELPQPNTSGLPQVAINHVELDYTNVNLIESKSFKLYLNSFNQTRLDSQDAVRQTLENNLHACVQGDVSVALYRLDELEGQPIAHFNGTSIDNRDITIDNYQSNTAYLESAVSGEKVVEEALVSHLLKSDRLITHQSSWGSIQIQYRGRRIDREKLPRYLVSFRHHNEFHEQCAERIFNDILRSCQLGKLSVYARYARHGGLDTNSWHTSTGSTPTTGRLVRQQSFFSILRVGFCAQGCERS